MQTVEDTIGAAIGRIPSGCSIMAAAHEGQKTGVLVSWVQQVAFAPPLISVSLKKGRPIVDLVNASGKFMLNVIGEDPGQLFAHFGKGFSLDDDAFEGLSFRTTGFGPIIESCIAHLKCEVRETVAAGDHLLYVAEVTGAGVVENAKPHLHVRKTGSSY